MSEVMLKERGITVHIAVDRELDTGELAVIAANAMDNTIAQLEAEEDKQENVQVTVLPQKQETTKVVQLPTKNVTQDRPIVRDRLPNEVDLNEYKFSKAQTESVLIRCPHCGQGHAAVCKANGNIYFLEKLKQTGQFEVIGESVCDGDDGVGAQYILDMSMKDDETWKDYYDAMQKCKPIDDCDMVLDNESEVHCPICHESAPFERWKLAYKSPESLFEYTRICDICGGEMDLIPTAEGRVFLYCNNCEHKEAIKD